jgi:hypothetical protein
VLLLRDARAVPLHVLAGVVGATAVETSAGTSYGYGNHGINHGEIRKIHHPRKKTLENIGKSMFSWETIGKSLGKSSINGGF